MEINFFLIKINNIFIKSIGIMYAILKVEKPKSQKETQTSEIRCDLHDTLME